MSLCLLSEPDSLPALDKSKAYDRPATGLGPSDPSPRILLLYGSLRERSFSRLAVEEAARILRYFGAETRIFDPSDLPLPDQVKGDDHPAVRELRELSLWSEGQVGCSPERHGQISGIMKTQIDHLPLEMGGMRPTQGRTLAVMQVSGGSQSFNAVNTLRLLGRWMRMFTLGAPLAIPFAVLHGAGNGLLTIARETLPLTLFGPAGYGLRTGILAAPSRLLQGVAPLLFGLVLDRGGPTYALALSGGLVGLSFFVLMILRAKLPNSFKQSPV